MSMNIDNAYRGILEESVAGSNNGTLIKSYKISKTKNVKVYHYRNVAGQNRFVIDMGDDVPKSKETFEKIFKLIFVMMKRLNLEEVIVVPYNSEMLPRERKFAKALLLDFVQQKKLLWSKVPHYPYQVKVTNKPKEKSANKYKLGNVEKL